MDVSRLGKSGIHSVLSLYVLLYFHVKYDIAFFSALRILIELVKRAKLLVYILEVNLEIKKA